MAKTGKNQATFFVATFGHFCFWGVLLAPFGGVLYNISQSRGALKIAPKLLEVKQTTILRRNIK